MSRSRLDPKLLKKLAERVGKKEKYIREQVSVRSGRLGISSEAFLIIWAKKEGIGTALYQRKLSPYIQSEIRDVLPSIFIGQSAKSAKQSSAKPKSRANVLSKRQILKSAIEYLIHDPELKDRCEDLILALSKFDRAINQATLVLEDRIRNKAEPTRRLEGVNLINYAFKGDLSKTILKVSDNPDEQDGFTNILRGVMLAFRNLTHHHVVNKFSREDALRVCGFIDVLLGVVDKSVKIR